MNIDQGRRPERTIVGLGFSVLIDHSGAELAQDAQSNTSSESGSQIGRWGVVDDGILLVKRNLLREFDGSYHF